MVLTYAVSKYASEIEACRYWFFDGQIVLYDQIDTALTYLELEMGLFEVVSCNTAKDRRLYPVGYKNGKRTNWIFTDSLGNNVF